MQNTISNHGAGVVGTGGVVMGQIDMSSFVPDKPAEWLIFFSTVLVLCQLGHYGWRFYKWIKEG